MYSLFYGNLKTIRTNATLISIICVNEWESTYSLKTGQGTIFVPPKNGNHQSSLSIYQYNRFIHGVTNLLWDIGALQADFATGRFQKGERMVVLDARLVEVSAEGYGGRAKGVVCADSSRVKDLNFEVEALGRQIARHRELKDGVLPGRI